MIIIKYLEEKWEFYFIRKIFRYNDKYKGYFYEFFCIIIYEEYNL